MSSTACLLALSLMIIPPYDTFFRIFVMFPTLTPLTILFWFFLSLTFLFFCIPFALSFVFSAASLSPSRRFFSLCCSPTDFRACSSFRAFFCFCFSKIAFSRRMASRTRDCRFFALFFFAILVYIYMFLRLCDFSMIVVWWFECGMIVWLQYDGVIVLFVNFCECIQIEEIAKKCKTKNRLKEPQKISLTFKFFRNISPNTATRGFPEDLWRLEENVFSRDFVCLRVFLCIYWRPWRAKVLFFILLYQRNIQY